MKDVTVTIEVSVAEGLRMQAARRNTSVSWLLGDMPAEKMRHDDVCKHAMGEALRFEALPFTGPCACCWGSRSGRISTQALKELYASLRRAGPGMSLLASAQQQGCALFLTEDLQHERVVDQLRIVNPFIVGPELLDAPA